MRLRSRNSRSMERGTDTSRPTASGNASRRPKHAPQVGADSIMRSREAGEVVKFRSRLKVDTKQKKTRSKNWGRLARNVQFWPRNDALLGESGSYPVTITRLLSWLAS